MSNLLNDAYNLLDDVAGFMDGIVEDKHPLRLQIEEWLKAYEKMDVEHDEVVDRVRRIETRLCILMEHQGIIPKSNGSFGQN